MKHAKEKETILICKLKSHTHTLFQNHISMERSENVHYIKRCGR